MKVLNFGSLNIDYVYTVQSIVKPGETIDSDKKEVFMGGKGLNQSIALAKAGLKVFHAGTIGFDGEPLIELCKANDIDTSNIRKINENTGHTIIQVDKQAQNSIILFGGANRGQDRPFIDDVLSQFNRGDILLLQNEINEVEYLIDKAYDKQMQIVLNPSPFNSKLDPCDLNKISIFIINEIEGQGITNEIEPNMILRKMKQLFPGCKVVLTVGKDGAYYSDNMETFYQKAFQVTAVDTTAAGDTFIGYFIAGMVKQLKISETMESAAMASAMAVSKKGASPSIPYFEEVHESLKRHYQKL